MNVTLWEKHLSEKKKLMDLVADVPNKWQLKEVITCNSVNFKILLYLSATFFLHILKYH